MEVMMDTHFQKELERLKEHLLKMATLVEKLSVIDSSLVKDSDLAQKTFTPRQIMPWSEIEDMCLKLLALRQPMAIDLRFITAAMKIITDLERMGDQAVIAEALFVRTPFKPY
jgi:phosphate transport system protein